MLSLLMRTDPGFRFVQFMRSDRGKAIDRFLVKHFGFSLLMKVFAARVGFRPIPVLMIYTVGRRSGQERPTVMPYLELNSRLYLIAANGAKPKDALWVENLRANPEARIVINRKERRIRGRELEPGSSERNQVWAFAATKTPQYNTYQSQMTRPAPIIALE